MNYKFCGIDLALGRSGVVVLDKAGNLLVSAALKTVAAKGCVNRTKRFMRLAAQVSEIVKCHLPCHVSVEGYSFGSGMRRGPDGKMFQQRGERDRAELRGMIYSKLIELGLEFNEPSPKSLKKILAGSGNASKDDMKAAALEWGYDLKTHDECDALAAAFYSGGWR